MTRERSQAKRAVETEIQCSEVRGYNRTSIRELGKYGETIVNWIGVLSFTELLACNRPFDLLQKPKSPEKPRLL